MPQLASRLVDNDHIYTSQRELTELDDLKLAVILKQFAIVCGELADAVSTHSVLLGQIEHGESLLVVLVENKTLGQGDVYPLTFQLFLTCVQSIEAGFNIFRFH